MITALALTASLVTAAQVQAVDVYLTGSTAFRAPTFNSVSNSLTGANAHGTSSGNNIWTITGTIGSTAYNVYASFSGSGTGIAAVQAGTLLTFTNNTGTGSFTHAAEFAFSDVLQANTAASGSPLLTQVTNTGVGIVPFTFLANSNAIAAGITNISCCQAHSFFRRGRLPLSFWTALDSDTNTPVYITGRDSGSGTRITTLLEVGWPIDFDVNQYEVVGSTWTAVGNDGYSSGSALRTALSNPNTGAPGVGYVGIADANAATGGAAKIAFGGFPFSKANVIHGKYQFWSREQLYYHAGFEDASALSYLQSSFITALDGELATDPTAVNLSALQVTNDGDGQPVYPIWNW